MVKKLYKHEFLAWLRVVPIIFGITLLTATLHRILQFFETDSVYYNIVNISAIVLFVVAMLATLVSPFIFGIVRSYKNLFTGEGYLTFTLPVKATTHLNVKVITASVFSIAAFLVGVASFCIITAGDVLTELWKAFLYLWKLIHVDYARHLTGYIAEAVVLALVVTVSTILLYNACLCVGQTAKKNRILLAVGAYFIYYFITQIIGTIFVITFTALDYAHALDGLYRFIEKHAWAAGHIGFAIGIVLYAGLGVIFWLISRRILNKKLNLE